jgi:hypothetical protein
MRGDSLKVICSSTANLSLVESNECRVTSYMVPEAACSPLAALMSDEPPGEPPIGSFPVAIPMLTRKPALNIVKPLCTVRGVHTASDGMDLLTELV